MTNTEGQYTLSAFRETSLPLPLTLSHQGREDLSVPSPSIGEG